MEATINHLLKGKVKRQFQTSQKVTATQITVRCVLFWNAHTLSLFSNV